MLQGITSLKCVVFSTCSSWIFHECERPSLLEWSRDVRAHGTRNPMLHPSKRSSPNWYLPESAGSLNTNSGVAFWYFGFSWYQYITYRMLKNDLKPTVNLLHVRFLRWLHYISPEPTIGESQFYHFQSWKCNPSRNQEKNFNLRSCKIIPKGPPSSLQISVTSTSWSVKPKGRQSFLKSSQILWQMVEKTFPFKKSHLRFIAITQHLVQMFHPKEYRVFLRQMRIIQTKNISSHEFLAVNVP